MAQEAPDGPLPDVVAQRTHDPLLLTTQVTVTFLLLGIVFLMTNKPSTLIDSLIVIAIVLALGLGLGGLSTPYRGTSQTTVAPGTSA